MSWICRVCRSENVEYVCDIPTSQKNKRGKFTIRRMAYCNEHKPAIYNPKIDKIVKYWERK